MCLGYNDQPSNLAYAQNHMKCRNRFCGQNTGLKVLNTYTKYCALKGPNSIPLMESSSPLHSLANRFLQRNMMDVSNYELSKAK